MKRADIDKLLMLLSTDWFFGYWTVAGLSSIDERRRHCVQRAAQKIIRAFIGSKQYWHVSFTDERLAGTRTDFFQSIKKCKLEEAIVERIDEIARGGSGRGVDPKDTWLLGRLTEMLVRTEPVPGTTELSSSIKVKVEDAWRATDVEVSDFERLCLESGSEWDAYIRARTPDLPSMVADYLTENLIEQNRFLRFWRMVCDMLGTSERRDLVDWYVAGARSLTGLEFVVPSWLDA
jgi:hypothetical protein